MPAVTPPESATVAVLTPAEAAGLVEDGHVVAVSGCVWNMVPERLCEALEARFHATGSPRDLTEFHLHIYGLGPDTGLERFAHPGLVRRVVGGSFAPPYWFKGSRMEAMVREDEIEAFVLPAGVIAAMFRETAAGRPGVLTEIGQGTFIDPAHDAGMVNDRARASGHAVVHTADVGDASYLYYPTQAIDVSFVRGTYADRAGNVTFEHEAMSQAVVEQAMATRASGGKVVVQVKEVVEGDLDPQLVRLPSVLVDAVVPVGDHPQFDYGAHDGSPAFSGELRLITPAPEAPGVSAATVAARRALGEVRHGDVVNLGAGVPVLQMPHLLWEAGLTDAIDVTVEHGSWGGVNLGSTLAATHWNPTAILDSDTTFDIYTGGGIDVAFLGFGQVDRHGDVNVAKMGSTIVGVGGFIDIAQSARTVVFCGTLRSGGLEVDIAPTGVQVRQEGSRPKFVDEVELVCFPARRAVARGQEVLYVTERAVFRVEDGALTLIEVAPGVDVQRDVLDAVECPVRVADDLATTPAWVLDLDVPVRLRTEEQS